MSSDQCVPPIGSLIGNRGLGDQALTALTRFAWSVPNQYRVELYIEPWNVASARTVRSGGTNARGREIGGRRVDLMLYAAIRPAG